MNQPPQEKQTGKQIVSKGAYIERLMKIVFGEKADSEPEIKSRHMVLKREYIRLQGLRMSLTLLATSLIVVGSLCVFACIVSAVLLALGLYSSEYFGLLLLLFFLPAAGIAFFLKRGFALAYKVQKIDPGVFLTRANTGDLPAPDSLVRASTEPVQEPQAILLRAAAGTQTGQEEQLLRASAGE